MITIYKYTLDLNSLSNEGITYIQIPRRANILCTKVQYSDIQIWAMVHTELPLVKRKIAVHATGQDCHHKGMHNYIGTVFLNQETIVLHLFDMGEAE